MKFKRNYLDLAITIKFHAKMMENRHTKPTFSPVSTNHSTVTEDGIYILLGDMLREEQ